MRNSDDPPDARHVHLTQDQVDVLHRARVVYAFIDVLADRGYAATTVADVAARAVMSSRTFYRLYDNKADAFDDMHRRIAARLRDCMCTAMQPHEEPHDKLCAAVQAGLLLLDEQPELGRAFVADGPAMDDGGEPPYLTVVRSWLEEVEALLPPSTVMSVGELAGAIGGVLRARLPDGSRKPSEMLPVLGQLLVGQPVDGSLPEPNGDVPSTEPPLKWDVVLGALADDDAETLAAIQRRALEELASGRADGNAADLAAMAEVAGVGRTGGLPAVLAIVGHGQGSAAALPSRQAVRCLRYVAANPGVTGRGVLRGLGFRNESQVSRLLAGLSSRGLVHGTEAHGGSREWTITAKGRALLAEHFGAVAE